jgi:hypothetical protein
MRKTFSALTLIAALASPVMVASTAQAQEIKIYDSAHKDYHVWNDDEDRAYRGYLEAHHRKYREFSKLSKKDQAAYWSYRHK